MLKAKGKLRVVYEAVEGFEEEFTGVIRIQLPLNYNAPKTEEKKVEENNVAIINDNEINANMVKPAEEVKKEENKIEVLEESFIEPYDGTTFLNLKEQYFGKILYKNQIFFIITISNEILYYKYNYYIFN